MKLPVLALAMVAFAPIATASTTYISADSTTGYFDTPTDGPEFDTLFVNISNGNGLSVPVGTLTPSNIGSTSHALGFVASNAVVRDNAGSSSITAEFGFNTPVDLSAMHVWNYTQFNCCDGRGINDYEVYVNTGSGFGGTPLVTGAFPQPTEVAGMHFAEEVSFGTTQTGVVGVRLVGLNNGGGNAIGLDEVVFAVVPEPSAGLLLMGALLPVFFRRRR